MKVEKVIGNICYIFSNNNLNVNDEVYHIGKGRCVGNEFIFHEINFDSFLDEIHSPDIIKDLNYSKSKPYQIHTSNGWGPAESYFKLIKKEQHVEINDPKCRFKLYKWVEIT